MNHQNLKCYGMLRETAKRMPTLTRMMPRGNSWLENQMKRALSSAMWNLAEGNGRTTAPDRNCFFDRATASIDEFISQLDWMFIFGYIPANLEAEIRTELTIASAMIRKLKRLPTRKSET